MRIFTNLKEQIIKQMSQAALKDSFFLTGRTALSVFYLRHRYSEDLDFFTEIPGAVSGILPILEDIGKKINVSIQARRTFNTFAELSRRVKQKKEEIAILHFAQRQCPYRLQPTVYNEEYGIYIDNLLDISCNKFSALFDRHDMKDFVDMYFIDKEKMKFEEIYAFAKKKHIGLDAYWLAQGLRYINDLTVLPRMIKPVTLKELQAFFNEKIKFLMAGL